MKRNKEKVKSLWTNHIAKHPLIATFGTIGVFFLVVYLLAGAIINAQIGIWWEGLVNNGKDNGATEVQAVETSGKEQSGATNTPHTVSYENIIADAEAAEDNYRFHEAIELYTKALSAYEESGVQAPIDLAYINARIGSNYIDLSDIIRAIQYIDAAIVIAEDVNITTDNYQSISAIYTEKCNYLTVLNDFYEAITLCHRILGIYDDVNDKRSPARAAVLTNLADIYYKIEDIENAIFYAEDARTILETYTGRADILTASTYLSLSYIYSDVNIDRAKEYCGKAYQIYKTNESKYGRKLISVYQSFANLFKDTDASESYNYALKRYEQCKAVYGETHQSTILSEVMLAGYKHGMEAVSLLEEAYIKAKKNYNQYSVEAGIIYANLANAYLSTYNQDRAKSLYEECLNIFKDKLGDNHTYVASIYFDLALLYKDAGDSLKQMHYAENAQAIYRNCYGESNKDVAELYQLIGDAELLYSGDYNKAMRYYEKSKSILEELYGTSSPITADCYVGIAHVYTYTDYYTANEYISAATDIYESTLGTTSANLAKALIVDAEIKYYTGRVDPAIRSFNRSLDIMRLYGRENSTAAVPALYLLSSCYYESGEINAASAYAKSTLEVIAMNHGDYSERPEFSGAYGILAKTYSRMEGMEQAAIDAISTALDLINGVNSASQRSAVYYDAAIVYNQLNDKPKALEYADLCYTATVDGFGLYHDMVDMALKLKQKIESN